MFNSFSLCTSFQSNELIHPPTGGKRKEKRDYMQKYQHCAKGQKFRKAYLGTVIKATAQSMYGRTIEISL